MCRRRAAVIALSVLAAGAAIGIGQRAQLLAAPLYSWRGADMRPVAPATVLRSKEGMIVEHVEPGSPAARAGLKAGDVIVALDGVLVGTARNFALAIADHCCGPTVTLSVSRDRHGRVIKLEPASDSPA